MRVCRGLYSLACTRSSSAFASLATLVASRAALGVARFPRDVIVLTLGDVGIGVAPVFYLTRCLPFKRVHNRGVGVDGLLSEFNRLPHHAPGPGGIASIDPQIVLQYLKHYVSRRLCAPRSNSPLPMAGESQCKQPIFTGTFEGTQSLRTYFLAMTTAMVMGANETSGCTWMK